LPSITQATWTLTPETYRAWENGGVIAPLPRAPEARLRHVLVVGGALAEWREFDRWTLRLSELGKVADHAGASWLTLHPYAGDGEPMATRTMTVGSCLVSADPSTDGRGRLVAAMRSVAAAGRPLTEESIAVAVNAPAEADPDLIVVLGTSDRLPPSLVWELAYGELVYVDVAWPELHAHHLEEAVNAFAARHRRFGGLDG
jgi:undecaprenyl diphosphate synthase